MQTRQGFTLGISIALVAFGVQAQNESSLAQQLLKARWPRQRANLFLALGGRDLRL